MTATAIRPTAFGPVTSRHCSALALADGIEQVGGKAHTLGRLLRAGVQVPDGFVIRADAFEAHRARAGVTAASEDGERSRALIRGTPLDGALGEELFALAQPMLAEGLLVVRSSAVGEDSASASFAGQLDSFLHIGSEDALEQAVLACWASFWSDRAIFYRRARGMTAGGMGVIVQAQVPARAAGVMFTRWDDARSILVEYTSGLADALVAGAIDPARFSIDRATGRVAVLSDETTPVDALVRRSPSLRSTADRLERELGGPQDVEWVMTADGTLLVVQSRPITTRTTSSRAEVVWSNANVNENFPEPISPLLYSVASAGYTHYFRNLGRAFGISRERLDAMEPSLRQIIGVHGARMYYNLTNIHAVIRLAPFGDALARNFDAFVGAGHESPPGTSPLRARSRARQAAELVVIAARTTWQYLFIGRRVRQFERVVDAYAARTGSEELAHATLPELGRLVGEFMTIRCHRWSNASLADTAAMVCYGLLQRVIRVAYPEKGDAAHTSLLRAIPDVVSNEPVHRLWTLSRMIRDNPALRALIEGETAAAALREIAGDARFADFRAALEQYLEQWGFRCSAELMLTVPSFQEEPAPVIDMLRAYARLDADTPHETMARQAEEREGETVRALGALRGKRLPYVPWLTWAVALRILLPWTHASIRYRERARLKQALLYSRLRRVALAMGDEMVRRSMIADRNDVFWLTADELQSIASGSAMLPGATRALVALRAEEHARVSSVTPPDALTLADGEYFDPSAASSSRARDTDSVNAIVGTTACTGRVSGRATVLRDVSEAERLANGDVLVTKQTDPGWGPVFFLIAGLVIERGGMLSHGAILAREFGLPCVVGVKDATRIIPDGAVVTVDGDEGRVHVAR